MSQGIAHFAVGATAAVLIVTFLVPNVRYPRTWVLVGGGWAPIPDAGKLVDHPATRGLHAGPWADLFWFHGTLDRLNPSDSTLWASVAVAAFIGATLVAERRSYRALEAVRDAVDDPAE